MLDLVLILVVVEAILVQSFKSYKNMKDLS